MQQTVEMMTRKLELLGAEKQGTFCVDCETYHTAASTISSQGQRRDGVGRAGGELRRAALFSQCRFQLRNRVPGGLLGTPSRRAYAAGEAMASPGRGRMEAFPFRARGGRGEERRLPGRRGAASGGSEA